MSVARGPYSVARVARMLQCSDRVVRDRAAELGGIKFGRDWVFPAGALFARLDAIALDGAAAPDPAAAPHPTAVLHPAPPATSSLRRTLPTLPQLGSF